MIPVVEEEPTFAEVDEAAPEYPITEAVMDSGQDIEIVEAEVLVAESEPAYADEFMAEAEPEPVPGVVREPLPKLAVNSTTWHPHQRRRTAQFSVEAEDGTRTVTLREGEMLGPLRLKEIGPTGVTFVHGGVEVKRRIGAGLR